MRGKRGREEKEEGAYRSAGVGEEGGLGFCGGGGVGGGGDDGERSGLMGWALDDFRIESR